MSLQSRYREWLADSEILVESVEPRYLLSADALGFDSPALIQADVNPGVDGAQELLSWWDKQEHVELHGIPGEQTSQADPTSNQREIVILDAGVVNGYQLLEDLLAEDDTSVDQIYLLDSTQDGVNQIASILSTEKDLGAVHIISHGTTGELVLGDSTLSNSNLVEYAGKLYEWGGAFAEDGDILFYGCDLASTSSGQNLVNAIGILTRTDVAASDDYTGNTEKGADWELEYEHGTVSSLALAARDTSSSWDGLLASIAVTTFNDIADGGDTSSISNLIATPGSDGISLREAIIAANNDSGQQDTITLSAGTYALAIGGTGEDLAATGDLDILDPLTITGAGADQTIIDGADLDRVFQVIASSTFSVTIADLKIQNGFVDNRGAGLHIGNVPAAASVTLTNVWFADNETTGTTDSGGAIFNRGTLTIQDSLIERNTAESGGGIMNFLDGILRLSNVTLSGNTATSGDGGAIFNASKSNYTNITVADNSASGAGGGLHNNDAVAATSNIDNSLVANNTAGSNPDIDGTFMTSTGGNLIETPGSASGLHVADITGIDPSLGSLNDNGGSTETHALLASSIAINRGVPAPTIPTADQRGVARDDNLPDIGAFEVANEVITSSFLLTTENDVTASGVSGIGAWDASEVLEFGEPSWSLGESTTGGQVSSYVDFGVMGLSPDGISALHIVGVDLTVGGTNSIDLQTGDLLLSVDKNGSTLTSSNSITVDEEDVFFFRPDIPGDYSQGTFTVLLEKSGMPGKITSVTLVEERTLVGDIVLDKGDFLLSREGGAEAHSVYRFAPTGVGLGTTVGTITELIDGGNVDISEPIAGLDLIEAATTVGGIDLTAGQLLVTLLNDDGAVGNASTVAVMEQDVFVLDISATGAGTSAATATLLLDGDNIGLDSTEETINGISLAPAPPNSEQVIATNSGHTVAEGSTGTVISAAMLETTDVDNTATELVYTVTAVPTNGTIHLSGTPLVLNDTFTQNDIDNSRITYDHDDSETVSDSVGFSVDDGIGTASSGTFALTVTAVNDEESVTTNTSHTVAEGSTGTVISTAMLETTDVDNTATELVYTVTAVPANGTVHLSGTPLVLNDTFTQDDIDNNRITYDHDNSETVSDSIGFSVDDGIGTASTGTFALTVTAVNDEQVIATNTGPTVAEGSTGTVISTAMLETTDVDNTATELVYTVTAVPTNGTVHLSGTPLVLNDTFMQDDIDNNRITYNHDDSETTNDSLGFSVDDGIGTASTGTFALTVTAVNDEESVTTNTGHTVAEGSTGTVISASMLETTDVDNTATELVYTVTAVPTNGTVHLSGTPLVLNDTFTQDDIGNNRITYDHHDSETTSDSIGFSVDDGIGTASTGAFALTVTAVNDEESVTTNTGHTVAEGSTGTVISTAMLETTDVDNTATELVYTVTAVPTNGTVHLSGTPLVLNDTFTQDDIDNNRITYDHDDSETTSDSIGFSVDDGIGTASTGTFALTVTAVNDEESVTTNTGHTVAEGSTGTVISTAMLETTDVDNTATELVYTVTAVPTNGTVHLSGTPLVLNDTFTQDDIDNNRITYDHDDSETTSDSIGFSVDDGIGTASTGTFALTVTAVNDEESVTTNTGHTVAEGSTGTIVTAGMLETTDVDNTPTELVYTVTAVPTNGTVHLSGTPLVLNDTFTQDDIDNNRLTYDHDDSETTSDSIGFSVDDGIGTASSGTFALTVTAVNDEQVIATNTGPTVAEGSTGTVISTAMLETTDVDNTATELVYTVTAVPTNGTVHLSGTPLVLNDTFTQDDIDNNRITYDHDDSETTSDSIGFSVDDGIGIASSGTFALTVTAVNDEESVTTNTSHTVAEGSTGTVISTAMLETTDVDNTATELVYTVTAVPANGTVHLSGTPLVLNDTFTQDDIDNNRITYDHDDSETTSDSIGFSVDDGIGTASTGTFALTVTAVNDEESVTTNTGHTVAEGSTGTIVTAGMLETTDVDNTPTELVYTVTAVPTNGTVHLSGTPLVLNDTFTQDDIDNNLITYDHDDSETTSDSIGFSVDDGIGTASTGTFALTVTAVNDEELVTTNTGHTVSEGSTGTIVTAGMLETTDVDNTPTELVYTITAVPTNGTVHLSGSPMVLNDTFTQDDIDNNRITYNHDDSETVSDSISFSVDDGIGTASTGTFALTITPVNEEQSVSTNTGHTVAEGSTGTVISASMLETTDVDNTATELVYTVTAVPTNGTVHLSGTPLVLNDTFTQDDIDNSRITYDHDDSETTSDSIGFSVDDGIGIASTGTFALTVTAVNDEESVTTNTGHTVAEGSTGTVISASMLETTDVDNTPAELVYTVTAVPTNGTVHLSGTPLVLNDTFTQDDIDNNRVTYNHDDSETTSDSIGFSVDDGIGTASSGTFALTVTAVNDEESVTTNTGHTVAEGSTGTVISASMLETTDVDNTATELVYTVTAVPTNGTVHLSGTPLVLNDTFTQDDIDNSRITYDHDDSETTSDSLGFSVDDGIGTASTGTFALTVTAVNDEESVTTNTGHTVAEGSTGTVISTAMLETTDVDNTATELVYTVTAVPTNGTVHLNGTPLELNDNFTQDDIDNNRITYDHDDSETTNDRFNFDVDDGDAGVISDIFRINILSENDPPRISGTVSDQIATEDILFTLVVPSNIFFEPDTNDSLTYLANQSNGEPLPEWLRFDSTSLTFSGTPTNDDVGKLTIRITAIDSSLANIDTNFNLLVDGVNDPPEVQRNTMVLTPGQSVVVNTQMLLAQDIDSSSTELTYKVSDVTGGRFELKNSPGEAITSFTIAQIDAANVIFIDDGDGIPPSYSIVVSDGIYSSAVSVANIAFSTPVLEAATEKTAEEDISAEMFISNTTQTVDLDFSPDPVSLNVKEGVDSDAQINLLGKEVVESVEQPPNVDISLEEPSSIDYDAASLSEIEASATAVKSNTLTQSSIMGILTKNSTILQVISAPYSLDVLSSEIRAIFGSQGFNEDLSRMRDEINNATQMQQVLVGSSIAVSTGLSVGYVAWLVRGGVLLSTVLSSMPAWQFIDPLPVLSNARNPGDTESADESLEDIINDRNTDDTSRDNQVRNNDSVDDEDLSSSDSLS